MHTSAFFEPIDYLAIGHIARDLTPDGARLGGTAAYAALTAQALGLKVGIVTAWGEDVSLGPLIDIPIAGIVSEHSTTLANLETSQGRVQTLHHLAPSIDYHLIPEAWRNAPIVHLGPIAQEITPTLIRNFPEAFVGVTAQGWLRDWDQDGRIFSSEWPEYRYVLEQAAAVVISIEDIGNDLSYADAMTTYSQLLAVTQGAKGAKIYWREDERDIAAPFAEEVDPVGAGDIFATAFFIQFHKTGDPWEAARFANQIASASVSQIGLASATTLKEIQLATTKV